MKYKTMEDNASINKQKENNVFKIFLCVILNRAINNKDKINYLEKQKLKEHGVTIMSLVITIVVLLILSGITIKFALSDNGILKQSKLASEKYQNRALQEQIALNQVAKEMENSLDMSSGNTSGSDIGKEDSDELQKQIEDLQNEVNSLTEQIQNEKAEKQKLQNQVNNLTKDLNTADSKINDLNSQITQKDNKINDLTKEKESLESQINTLKEKQATGNASPAQVLSGVTFSSATKIGQTGTMSNRSGVTTAWSGYETISVEPHPADNTQGLVTISNQYVAEGYYDKSSKITGNVANLNAGNIKAGVNIGRNDGSAGITGTFTSDGTATADDITSGKVAYVNGQRLVGTGLAASNNYNTGKSDGANQVLKALYNSPTVKNSYAGISKMTSCDTSSWSSSTSGSVEGYIPLTYSDGTSYYMLNTITGSVRANGRAQADASTGNGSATITFYTFNSSTGQRIAQIGSATKSENASTSYGVWGNPNNYSIALLEKNIDPSTDKIYYTGSVSGYCCAGTHQPAYAGGTGGGIIDTIVATYVKVTI